MAALHDDRKPIIGISCGDINGIGPELIIKSLSDNRILEFFTPVVFGNNKLINFYRKSIANTHFSFHHFKSWDQLNPKQVNVFNCWDEEVNITPGELTDAGGQYAVKSLEAAVQALKDGNIDALVTAPIHKKNVYSAEFPFTGHTPYLQAAFNANDVLMLLYSEDFRMGLVTEHCAVKDIAQHISISSIGSKLDLMHQSLQRDFNITTPKIAVLALNPHAGDYGLIGSEEEEIIKPAVKEAKQKNRIVIGPFSADAFFARGYHLRFDGVLAMYHDQGLIPFKSLATTSGINFTAGLPIIRTSPDHGTAFDIAGKDKADASSFTAALFESLTLIKNRRLYDELRQNPLQKLSKGGSARDDR